jgi:sugar lactone lactonase YvrE
LPAQLAFDPAGRLYAADIANNRVLVYPAGASTGSAASAVFGQPNLTSGGANNPNLGPSSLVGPIGVAVDADGNVYISDSGNNRVLEYDQPLGPSGNFSADRVFGQPNFTTNTANGDSAASETSLRAAKMLTLDAAGDLFVADAFNARLLQYLTPVAQKLRLYLPLTRR